MKRLSPAAEFEHLPQNRDPAPSRRIPQHAEHGASRVWIGVVAIVKHKNSLVAEALAAHLARLNLPDAIRKALRSDSKNPCHGDAGQQVRDAVAAGARAFERSFA